MKVLHLTLKRKWFDMIASGEKKEEYREFKVYWVKRLMDDSCFPGDFKHFDAVKFNNGYSSTARTMTWRFSGISFGNGRKEWGAEQGKQYFVIKLGERIA